jgi:alpha-galactosidase
MKKVKKSAPVKMLLLFCCCFSLNLKAQDIAVETSNTALVYRAGKDGQLLQVYFGKKLGNEKEYQAITQTHNTAFPGGGATYAHEPAMEVIHSDGNSSLQLNYVSHTVEQEGPDIRLTTIHLKDPAYPFFVTLYVKAFLKEDVMETWTSIQHEESSPVTLQRYASSFLSVNGHQFYLTHFYGDWASEMQMDETLLPEGLFNIQSKLGTRATNYGIPSFLLSPGKRAEENSGEVIAGTLAWSGNFNLQFENLKFHGPDGNSLKIIPGINAYASAYSLNPKESFTTPHFIFTCSYSGSGQASRNLHQWALNYGIWNGRQKRQTLLNNWEATYFNFNQDTLVNLFGGAKKLGVDVFLLDDGWFGNKYPRNSDKAGLGDWQANKQKLPNGIGYLVQEAEKQNVHFGIWVEPEMVNPKSSLYEQHPDWIIRLPNRPEDFQRNQLVLDLCNPKVQDFVYGVLHDLLSKNPGIAYIKWDCNRYISNGYSMYLGKNQQALYVDYVRGLYSVLERIRKEYPTLEMMLCSGGGGRAEYGALKYFQEFWPSDNTDALSRIFIQWGYSYFFPAATLCNHVTSAGKQSLKFKLDVAMTGKLGFDIQVNNLSAGDLKFCRNAVENYKRLQNTINFGSLYRLVSPYQYNSSALMYADSSSQHAVLFAYNLHTVRWDNFSKLMLQGLDASKKYKVEEINLEEGKAPAFRQSGQLFTGDYLMKEGLDWYLRSPLSSSILEITAIE